jgi:hypothetical protein
MNKLLKDRVKLIRAIEKVSKNFGFCFTDLIRKDLIDFLSVNNYEEGMVSYARTVADRFNEKRRIKTTLGKYLSRKYSVYMDLHCEKFIASIWAALADNYEPTIKILHGAALMSHYASLGRDNASKSCMTGASAWKIQLLEVNSNSVGLVIMDDELRALLWKTDDGAIVLDRIYPNGHWKIDMMKRWAAKQGYLTRVDNGLPKGKIIQLSDGSSRSVTLKNFCDVYPYLDTFCFGSYENRMLTLTNHSTKNGRLLFNNADGGHMLYDICTGCEVPVASGRDDIQFIDDKQYCYLCAQKEKQKKRDERVAASRATAAESAAARGTAVATPVGTTVTSYESLNIVSILIPNADGGATNSSVLIRNPARTPTE